MDLIDVVSGHNLQKINDNFIKIETELNEKVLYRKKDDPADSTNVMENDIDVNGHRIYNLPKAELNHEPVRYKEFHETIQSINPTEVRDEVVALRDEVVILNTEAQNSANDAEESATQAAASAASVDAENIVHKTDLAASGGASMVGYQDRTVEEALDDTASKGANSDITSLSGLTTALSIGQGGTGVKSLEELITLLNVSKPQIPVFGSTAMDAFGDSFTEGNGSDGYNSYPEIIGAHLNAAFSNRGVSGTGVTKACTQAFAHLPKRGMQRRVITLMAGFNDLYRQGPTPKTLTKMEHATKAFLANAFLKTVVPASDSSVTKTGTWSDTTPGVLGEKAQSLGGSSLIYTDVGTGKISWGFTGDSVVVGCWDSDGSVYVMSDIDVYLDGVFVERVVFADQTDGNAGGIDIYNGLTHTALVYTGCGSGAHTIELRAVTSDRFFVDYFGTLAAPSDCPSVLVGDVCFLNEAGYEYESLRSIEGDKLGIAAIRRAVAFFASRGFPVVSVPVNDFYDLDTDVNPDNIHPNVAGHLSLAKAFISCMSVAPFAGLPGVNLSRASTQSIPTGVRTFLAFDTPPDDRHGMFSSTAPTVIKAPTTGVMRVSGSCSWPANGTGIRNVQTAKNGVPDTRLLSSVLGTAGNVSLVNFYQEIKVVAGDSIEIGVSQDSGTTLNLSNIFVDVAMIR